MYYPQPARHARFRRSRVLIVGCGDVGLRAAQALLPRCRVLALSSQAERLPALRANGLVPLRGDLDAPASLARLAGLATRVLHLAPPPGQGAVDGRTAAEARLRWWGRRLAGQGGRVSILRIPGIYALDRVGGDPRDRVRKGSPLLRPEDDVHTNHIHADDLARACVAALWRGKPGRIVHACDDTAMRMGDYFDWVADHFGLPRAPRIAREEAARVLSPVQLSFLSESRQLRNDRLKRELRLKLRYPTIQEGLASGR